MIHTLAGTGEEGFNGDGIPAARAQLSYPSALASDRSGNLYIADQYNYRIRRIDSAGVITTTAGTGQRRHSGDGGKAIAASFEGPSALAVDSSGNLFVAEFHYHRVRRIDPDGIITTIAGTGKRGCGGDGGPAAEALLDSPAGLAVDGEGNLFVADRGNHRVRRIAPDGSIATAAGTGTAGYIGDGGPATEAFLCHPKGLASDGEGNVFVSDHGNHRVRRIDRAGVITTVAGTGMIQFSGDWGPAVFARLFGPDGLAIDRVGNIYVGDVGNHRVRRIDRAGIITTVVGTGEIGNRGDGGPAFEALVHQPEALTVDRDGLLLVADSANHNVRITRPENRVSVTLGERRERYEFEFAAYGTLWRDGAAYFDGSEVTASDRSIFVLRSGAGGAYSATRRCETQTVALPGGAIIHLEPHADGSWRIGSDIVASGLRCVYQGIEHVLDFFGGRWRLVEHTVRDLIGTPDPLDGIPAAQADLEYPSDVAVDRRGNVYVAEVYGRRVRRIDRGGLIATTVDYRRGDFNGSVDPALGSSLFPPERLAVDHQANLYFSEWGCGRVCKVDSDGSLSTFAGLGPVHRGHAGEQIPAVEALLSRVGGIASDARGQVYLADMDNHCIRRVDAAGVVATIAGVGKPGFGGDGGPAREALLDSPAGLAVDESGSVYVSDQRNARVRRIDREGIIDTVAGGGERKLTTGDGSSATAARLGGPTGLATDGGGNIYIVNSGENRLRCVSPDGTISTLAGTGTRGRAGDCGPGTAAQLNLPVGVATDTEGRAYVADAFNHRVRRIGGDGRIETIAGTGKPGSCGDGGPARKALLRRPFGVAVDTAGSVYITDTGNHRIRKVDPSGLISTVAGTGDAGYGGDGGPAWEAAFDWPYGVAVDGSGNVYASDSRNHRIRKIDPSGTVSTVAGNGEPGYGGDGGPAVEAMLSSPALIATDAAGNVYVADEYNNRVRKIDSEGIASTVAGSGRRDHGGDRGPADQAFLDGPVGIAVGQDGDIYVADRGNGRVRKIGSDGIITTFAGGGDVFSTGDGGLAEEAHFEHPRGIAVDASGSVYVADRTTNRIRKFTPRGRITTYAGTGEAAYGGDGGPADEALLRRPEGLAADASGNVYVADSGNHRVRRIDTSGVITTIAGTGHARSIWEGGPPDTTLIRGIVADSLDRICMATPDSVWRLDHSGTVSLVAGTARDGFDEKALFDGASRVAADDLGNLYVAEECRVRRIDAGGAITAFAGTGERSDGCQRPAPVPAPRDYPTWVGTDAAGNVYYLDVQNWRIRKIDPSGEIATVIALGELLDSDDLLDLKGEWGPLRKCVAVDATGNLFIAWSGGHMILKIDANGNTSTFAGTGEDGGSGDGGPATSAQLSFPDVIGTDEFGNLYVVECHAERIRKIDRSGMISTIAGPDDDGFPKDDDVAVPADFGDPNSVSADAAGNVYVSDWETDHVLRIDPSGTVHAFVGWEGHVSPDVEDCNDADEVDPAANAGLSYPTGLATDVAGTVYVADSANHRVCAINSVGVIRTIAGTGEPGYGGDGGPATQAALCSPQGVAVDASGNVYIADSGNRSVRKVDAWGVINSLYAEPPPPPPGYGGDGGPAVQARFLGPLDVAADWQGNVYVADAGDHRVRKIDADGTITMFAGTGQRGDEGDGGRASKARLNCPFRITVDSKGSVYVAEKKSFRIRKIDSEGDIVTVAGTGIRGRAGDDGPGVEADLDVRDIAADLEGNLFLTDGRRVRKIDPSGVISTIAGAGRMLADGDGGPPVKAHFLPRLVATSRAGDIWFVDGANDRVRALRRNPPQQVGDFG